MVAVPLLVRLMADPGLDGGQRARLFAITAAAATLSAHEVVAPALAAAAADARLWRRGGTPRAPLREALEPFLVVHSCCRAALSEAQASVLTKRAGVRKLAERPDALLEWQLDGYLMPWQVEYGDGDDADEAGAAERIRAWRGETIASWAEHLARRALLRDALQTRPIGLDSLRVGHDWLAESSEARDPLVARLKRECGLVHWDAAVAADRQALVDALDALPLRSSADLLVRGLMRQIAEDLTPTGMPVRQHVDAEQVRWRADADHPLAAPLRRHLLLPEITAEALLRAACDALRQLIALATRLPERLDHAAWLLAAGRLQSSMVRATAHVPGADECRESSTAGWLLRHPLAATPPVDADEVLARQLTRPDYYSGQNRLLRFFLDAPKAVRKARLAHLARMTEAGPKRQTPKQLAKVLGNPRGQMDLLGLAPNDRD